MSALETVDHNTVYTFVVQVASVLTGDNNQPPVLKTCDREGITRFIVFTPTSPGYELSWSEGEWYRFESVIGCDPKRPLHDSTTRRRDRLESGTLLPTNVVDIDPDICPRCNGQLQLANALVLPEETQLLINSLPQEFMLVGTESSSFEKREAVQIQANGEQVSREPQPPSRVKCSSCGCTVKDYYRSQPNW
jgi:hypothetical protein